MADEYGFRDNVPFKALITGNGPTNIGPPTGTAYLYTLMYNCTNAGTTWSLKITDNSSPTPLVICNISPLVVTPGAPVVLVGLEAPIPITGGLTITGTGTAGSVSLFGNYSQN